jgi:carboxylesterase
MFVPVTHPDAQPFQWEGHAPACLLIHGLTSTPWEVRSVGIALRDAGFHAESFWLPGHGTTPEELAKVRWIDWAETTRQHYARLKASHGSVAVLGTSLGGSLALWMGVTEEPAAVVTMGGAVRLRSPARFARLMSRFRPFVNKRPKGSSIFDDEARARHPSYPRNSMHAVAEMYDLVETLRPRIREITAPLLVMHARQDSVIHPDNAQWIYEHASSEKKRLLWLENSDHIITEDFDHELVEQAAVAWIEMVDGVVSRQSSVVR